MNDTYTQIDNWFSAHQDALLRDLSRLVRIPSVSAPDGGELPFGQPCRQVLDEFCAISRELGLSPRLYEYYAASAALGSAPDGDCIGLWCHLDVVPAGSDWLYSPFSPTVTDGFIIGRGVDDNKGPAAALLYVLACLRDLGFPLRHTYKIFVGCDEERGMEDLRYFTSHYPCPRLSLVADSGFPVCYGEMGIWEADLVSDVAVESDILDFSGGTASNVIPDRAAITLRYREDLYNALLALPGPFQVQHEGDRITVESRGVSQHSASPQGSVNAIHEITKAFVRANLLTPDDASLFRFFNQINETYDGAALDIAASDDDCGALVCSGTMIKLTDGHLRLHINCRYPMACRYEAILTSAAAACAEHGFHIESSKDNAPARFPKDHPVVTQLTEVFASISGREASPYAMKGGTYARKLPNAIGYGFNLPGRSCGQLLPAGHGGAHQPDEIKDIGQLLAAAALYAKSILAIDELEL